MSLAHHTRHAGLDPVLFGDRRYDLARIFVIVNGTVVMSSDEW